MKATDLIGSSKVMRELGSSAEWPAQGHISVKLRESNDGAIEAAILPEHKADTFSRTLWSDFDQWSERRKQFVRNWFDHDGGNEVAAIDLHGDSDAITAVQVDRLG